MTSRLKFAGCALLASLWGCPHPLYTRPTPIGGEPRFEAPHAAFDGPPQGCCWALAGTGNYGCTGEPELIYQAKMLGVTPDESATALCRSGQITATIGGLQRKPSTCGLSGNEVFAAFAISDARCKQP